MYRAAPHNCVFALRQILSANSAAKKFEIHTVFLRFSNLALTKNLSSNLLAELCGIALENTFKNGFWKGVNQRERID